MSNHPKSDRKHGKPLTWHGRHSLQEVAWEDEETLGRGWQTDLQLERSALMTCFGAHDASTVVQEVQEKKSKVKGQEQTEKQTKKKKNKLLFKRSLP